MNLQDQNILITGAAEGLGESIASAFAKEKSNLFLLDKNIDKLNLNNQNNAKNCCVDLSNIKELKKNGIAPMKILLLLIYI